MPSTKSLTKLSVLIFFCFQLFMGSIAYPIAEKANQESKIIKPRAFGRSNQGAVPAQRSGGIAKPLVGGVLLGGGAALAYKHFRKGSNDAPAQ